MKERPILFSAPMVRALLAGTKTQTRRVVKPRKNPDYGCHMAPGEIAGDENVARLCPHGQPGDRLWVRETHLIVGGADSKNPRVVYAATNDGPDAWQSPAWRPSIHMPRWASRITLEVTGVRVERLQDISEADAWAEGCTPGTLDDNGDPFPAEEPHPSGIGTRGWDSARDWYADLWEAINGEGSWDANPWVWVVEFERVTP